MATLTIERESGDRWDFQDDAVIAGLQISTHDAQGTLRDLCIIKLDDDGWNALGAVVLRRIRESEGAAQLAAEHHTDVFMHAGRFIGKCDSCPETNPDQTSQGAVTWAREHGIPAAGLEDFAARVKGGV